MNIKNCPFCGEYAELVKKHWCVDMQFEDDHDEAYVECKSCGAKSGVIHIKNARYRKTCKEELEQMKIDAINKWNNRIKQAGTIMKPCQEWVKEDCAECPSRFPSPIDEDWCHVNKAYHQALKDFVEYLNNNAFELRHDMELIRKYAVKYLIEQELKK